MWWSGSNNSPDALIKELFSIRLRQKTKLTWYARRKRNDTLQWNDHRNDFTYLNIIGEHLASKYCNQLLCFSRYRIDHLKSMSRREHIFRTLKITAQAHRSIRLVFTDETKVSKCHIHPLRDVCRVDFLPIVIEGQNRHTSTHILSIVRSQCDGMEGIGC